MKKSIQILFVVITILLIGQSCANDVANPTATPTATLDCSKVSSAFTANVKPIFATNCAIPTCHNAATASSGFVFETYDQIKSGSGRALVSIKNGNMPRNITLSASQRSDIINTIQCWINANTPNN